MRVLHIPGGKSRNRNGCNGKSSHLLCWCGFDLRRFCGRIFCTGPMVPGLLLWNERIRWRDGTTKREGDALLIYMLARGRVSLSVRSAY